MIIKTCNDKYDVNGNIYIMSDIHSCINTFKKGLRKIKFSENDFLIINGDIIDRGNANNYELIKYIKKYDNILLIRGNHEEFFLRTHLKQLSLSDWSRFGGKNTISELNKLSNDEYLEFYNYINETPLYCIVDIDNTSYFISHNGFNLDLTCIYENDLLDQEKTIIKQYNENWFDYICSCDIYYIFKMKFKYKWIVGHYPTIRYGEPKILFEDNFIDIDCGLTNGGKLGVLKLNTMEEILIDVHTNDL